MDVRFFLVISAVILAAFLVDNARGGRGGRRRGWNEGNRYQWARDLGSGRNAPEEAFAPTSANVVFLKSIDDSLTPAGFNKSNFLYDFTSTSPVLAISLPGWGRRSPCFVADTQLTYQGVIDTLTARNEQTVPVGPQVSWDGTGAQLSRDEAQTLTASNSALRRFCKRGRIVRLSTNPAASSTNGTEVVRVLTLDTEVRLVVPVVASRQRHGGGRGGRRGWRGNGRRGGRH